MVLNANILTNDHVGFAIFYVITFDEILILPIVFYFMIIQN